MNVIFKDGEKKTRCVKMTSRSDFLASFTPSRKDNLNFGAIDGMQKPANDKRVRDDCNIIAAQYYEIIYDNPLSRSPLTTRAHLRLRHVYVYIFTRNAYMYYI